MIPSLLSISLIYGCMPSMAFIFLATSTSGCPSSSLLRILAVRAFWMFLMAAVLERRHHHHLWPRIFGRRRGLIRVRRGVHLRSLSRIGWQRRGDEGEEFHFLN